jgi:murein DD-endopeptidase MepM/ murein hydrolase activator NlpD
MNFVEMIDFLEKLRHVNCIKAAYGSNEEVKMRENCMTKRAFQRQAYWAVMSIALTCLFVSSLISAQAETGVARESVKSLHVAFAPMEPIFQTAPALPTSRPDPALAYPAIPVSIIPPVSKPALIDVLPKSTETIGEMIRTQTGLESGAETELKLRDGEGIGALLRRAGYSPASIAKAIDAVSGKASLRRLQIGTKFQVTLQGFRFSTKPGRDIYVIQYPDSGWLALTALRPTDRYMNFFQGTVDDSIYRSAMVAGISESAFNDYIRVMGFSVDFQREIRTGDRFELLYETKRDSISGKVISGKLHYAGLVLSDEQLGFFRYESDKDTIGWYDENGNSAARTLIRTPISGARLSSSFGHRKHPISGFNAMHKGVDFAAPLGTPIIAAGSGVIREAGWKGSFGRYIRIRHNATYDTAYAHMSRIAPNIHLGSRVKQGEIIGYVGSTGRSTGAHLHYEVMVNNRQVNPMTVRLPTGERIDDQHLATFKKTIAAIDQEVLSHGTIRFAGDMTIKNTQ